MKTIKTTVGKLRQLIKEESLKEMNKNELISVVDQIINDKTESKEKRQKFVSIRKNLLHGIQLTKAQTELLKSENLI